MNKDFVKRSPARLSLSEGGDPENLVKKKKTKRMRTTFTEEQIQILQVEARIDLLSFQYFWSFHQGFSKEPIAGKFPN